MTLTKEFKNDANSAAGSGLADIAVAAEGQREGCYGRRCQVQNFKEDKRNLQKQDFERSKSSENFGADGVVDARW